MRQSLRLRLPLLISGLIAVSLVAFLSVSYQQVYHALVRAGEVRAQAVSDQLAGLLVQSAQQRLTEMRRVSRDPAVAQYLRQPDPAAAAAARQRLATLTVNNQPPVELWNAAGSRVLQAEAAKPDPRLASLPSTEPPAAEGVSPFKSAGDVAFWDVAAAVRPAPAETGAPGAPPLGFIVSRRVLTGTGTSSEAISRLVGADAIIKLGSPGGAWSDLVKPVPGPTADVHPGLIRDDRGPDGAEYLASAAAVRGTPWLVLVEFPRAVITAPARSYLWRMLVIVGVLVLASAALAHGLSARITTPLHQLTHAAERLAQGRFEERVPIDRRDEIGRLAVAFQTMATEVQAARQELEARVEERTRDIVALNTQLEGRVGELKALSGELEAFSYSVSHDLRAPLRHVGGFAALLEKSAGPSLDEQGRRYVQTISEAAARMGRLIDDLLAFSRMGRAEMLRARVDLSALVEDVRRDVHADRPPQAIEWTVHPLPVVAGDPAMLRLALTNLLSNAVKYSAPRSPARIEVGCLESADENVIFVRDNGVGFDMEHAGNLFGVFQRLHSAEQFEGTGIGLANVRRILHRHGGRVWAESAPDQGATFFMALPRLRPSAAA